MAFGTEAAGRGAGAAANAGAGSPIFVAWLASSSKMRVDSPDSSKMCVASSSSSQSMSTEGLALAFAGLVTEAGGGGGMLDVLAAGGATTGGSVPRPGGGGGMRDGEVGAAWPPAPSRRGGCACRPSAWVCRPWAAGAEERFARRSGEARSGPFSRGPRRCRGPIRSFRSVPWHESPACAAHRGYHGGQSSLLEPCAECNALCAPGCQLPSAVCDAFESFAGGLVSTLQRVSPGCESCQGGGGVQWVCKNTALVSSGGVATPGSGRSACPQRWDARRAARPGRDARWRVRAASRAPRSRRALPPAAPARAPERHARATPRAGEHGIHRRGARGIRAHAGRKLDPDEHAVLVLHADRRVRARCARLCASRTRRGEAARLASLPRAAGRSPRSRTGRRATRGSLRRASPPRERRR